MFKFQTLRSRAGFTLIELLVFAAIFTMTSIGFISILVSFTRVRVRQEAAAEVNQQSQFVLQTIQQYIEQSSLVDLSQDSATTTLKLRIGSSTGDPVYIYASGTAMYVKITDAGAEQALTSSRVIVSNISFTKRANTPGHDSVSIAFTLAYNNPTPQSKFSQIFSTAIARVSAATFDSNVIPSTGTLKLGVSGQTWSNINDKIYFSGSNVGIGITPTQILQVSGGDVYVSSAGNGIIFKAPNGTSCFKATINNSGTMVIAAFTCT